MHRGSEWAETVSSKIWTAPIISLGSNERVNMEVDWENRWGLHGYLVELWDGIKWLRSRFHAYTKLKQG